MPQPLSSVNPRANIFIGNNNDSPSKTRPELGLAAMNVIAEWSILESFINGVFVQALGANPTQAAAIFATIRSPQGQRDAFTAAIAVSLPNEDERNIIYALLDEYERAGKPRNKIAHWTWGHSPDLPDAALLANPVAMSTFQTYVVKYCDRTAARVPADGMPLLDPKHIHVYRLADFESASLRIQEAMALASRARLALARKTDQGAPELLQLSTEPAIRKALDRLNKDRQADP